MYVDSEIPNTYISPCPCCGCGDENSCCCDFLTNLDNSYWSSNTHTLFYSIQDNECSKLNGVSGCMTPTTQGTDNNFCSLMWESSVMPLNSECGIAVPVNMRYFLYCQTGNLGENDPAINSSYGCNNGYKWRLKVTMSNSSCDFIPDDDTGSSDTDISSSGFSSILYQPFAGDYNGLDISKPKCNPTGTCPPNLGEFSVSFRVEAPHNNEDFPTTSCSCCDPQEHYIVSFSLNQDQCPTAKFGSC